MLSRRLSRARRKSAASLSLEKLESRNLLTAVCGELDAPILESASTKLSEVELIAETETLASGQDLAESAALSGALRVVQRPTTVELGELNSPEVVRDSNSYFDRVDRYEFQVSSDGHLEAKLRFDRNTWSQLLIFDASRNLVSYSTIRGGSQTSISTELPAGEYVAIVYRGFGRYQLELDFAATNTEQPGNEPNVPDIPEVTPPSTPDNQEPSTPPTSVPTPNPVPSTELPSAAYYGSNLDWNLNSVNAPEAWQAGQRGEGVVVAVIDTGVNVNHSDLNDNIWVNAGEIAGDGIDNDGNGYVDDYYGWNFVANNANILDDNGHGTHVAGTISAEQNGFGATGVAPDADIMSIKVLNSSGSGFMSSIASGIRYAVDNGAQIINLSLGGGFSTTIASALGYAAANDVLVVAAAGNEGAIVPGNPATLSSQYSNVLSVGAYNINGSIAGFSNGVGHSGAVQVDAPGVNIYSTAANGRYTFLSGTSMAAPHVAGVAALTLSANSNLTAASLRNIIVQTSNRTADRSDAQGVVNASLAIPLAINGSAVGNSSVGNSVGQSSGSQRIAVSSASAMGDLVVVGSQMTLNSASTKLLKDVSPEAALNSDSFTTLSLHGMDAIADSVSTSYALERDSVSAMDSDSQDWALTDLFFSNVELMVDVQLG